MWVFGVAAVLAAVVGAELVARWAIRRGQRYCVWTPRFRLRMELDGETHPQLDRVVHFQINSRGERGAEPPGPRERAFRVLVIGGSSAECYLLDQPKAWPAVLERLLSKPDRLATLGRSGVHVANIARSAMRSASVRVIAERILPRYERVDVIVLFMGASDVIQWLSRGADPGAVDDPVRVDEIFAYHPETAFTFSVGGSALREVLRRARDRARRSPEVRQRAARWIGRARAMRARATEFRDTVPDSAPLTREFAANLDAVIEQALKRATHVLVVRQPWFDDPTPPPEAAALFWNGGVGNPQSDDITTYYTDRVLIELLSAIDRTTVDVARKRGLTALDLRNDLRSDVANYYDQFHYTNEGARLVAERVGDAIMDAHTGRRSNRAPS